MDGDALYGLGSNDAGGPLVSLLAAFLYYHESDELPFNLLFAATAEEEISGDNGMVLAFPQFGRVDLAIIGEPSGMALTIAERGHMTLEVLARGKSGHAGREIGVNAITKALPDIQWFHNFRFPRESDALGSVKMSVTKIHAGTSSNAIPDECRFVVDVRTTDQHQNEEVFDTIKSNLENEVRSTARHLKASRLPDGHPLITAAKSLNLDIITSPTSSDQGLIDVPSVKIGPGQSERSHTSDEFIRVSEIYDGIEKFISLLSVLKL
jgi:acetylornithine deacetylase